jgi:hypothetical protein
MYWSIFNKSINSIFFCLVICLGGIGNVIQYICNEGFRYQSTGNVYSDYKSETKSEADEAVDEQKSNDDSIITNNVWDNIKHVKFKF